MSLGKEIRKARIDRGLKQKDLAGLAGLSLKYMCQIEGDGADPRVSIVHRIAVALGVSLDQIVKEERHA